MSFDSRHLGLTPPSGGQQARHELERQLSRVDTCIALSANQHRDLFSRVRTLGIFNELLYRPGPSQFRQ